MLLDKIHEILISNADRIIQDIQKEKENIPKERNQNVLLTIKIRKENSEMFIGQNKKVIEILKSQFVSDINTDTISPRILQCLFCNKNKESMPEKLKISDIFSFSTFDKKGFLYNFDESNKNKQTPMCNDCYINLKRGKEWLDKYTYFNFEGYKYYLIPSINDYFQNQSTFKYFIKIAEKYQSAKSEKKQNLQYENGLMQEEEDLLESMVKDGFTLTLEFLFVSLKGGGKYMDIERHIEDVPLTWIRKIYNVYKDILNQQIFNENSMKNIIGQKWEGPLRNKKREIYLAALIKFFFPSDSLDIEFLTVISNILQGRSINSNIMYRAFLRKIRNEIFENYSLAKINTIKSFVLFLILKRLKLI
ncbi:MAG: TM1802 family CRISPR-associated protein, partial [Deltaproteobacteria bacterium]